MIKSYMLLFFNSDEGSTSEVLAINTILAKGAGNCLIRAVEDTSNSDQPMELNKPKIRLTKVMSIEEIVFYLQKHELEAVGDDIAQIEGLLVTDCKNKDSVIKFKTPIVFTNK